MFVSVPASQSGILIMLDILTGFRAVENLLFVYKALHNVLLSFYVPTKLELIFS